MCSLAHVDLFKVSLSITEVKRRLARLYTNGNPLYQLLNSFYPRKMILDLISIFDIFKNQSFLKIRTHFLKIIILKSNIASAIHLITNKK